MSSPIQVLGIDHVVLRVADVERSLHFYTVVLGCAEERRVEKLGLYQLRAGSGLIDLVDVNGPLGKLGGAPPAAAGRNVDHFALRIEKLDEKLLREYLERHGVEPGEVGRRYGADGYGPSVYIPDPDGNVVELKGPPDPGGPDAG